MNYAGTEPRAETPRGVTASLSVRDVTVTYPSGVTALKDASFELGPGTTCGLVGVNGSGKSTLFKAIMPARCASVGCPSTTP